MFRYFLISLSSYFIFSLISNIDTNNQMYLLALEKNPNLEAYYSIHGLWPQYVNGSYPQFCKKVTFNEKNLENLLPSLEKYWPSDEGSNDDFWKHEWEKHGSCMFISINETEYFEKALALYKKAWNLNIIKKKCLEQDNCYIKLNRNFKFIPNSEHLYEYNLWDF